VLDRIHPLGGQGRRMLSLLGEPKGVGKGMMVSKALGCLRFTGATNVSDWGCRAGRGVAFSFCPFPSYEDIGRGRLEPSRARGFCAFIGAKPRPLTARTHLNGVLQSPLKGPMCEMKTAGSTGGDWVYSSWQSGARIAAPVIRAKEGPMLMRTRSCCMALLIGLATFSEAQSPSPPPAASPQTTNGSTSSPSPSAVRLRADSPSASTFDAASGLNAPSVSIDFVDNWSPAPLQWSQPFQLSLTDQFSASFWNAVQAVSNNISAVGDNVSIAAVGIKNNPIGAAAAVLDTAITIGGSLVDPPLGLTIAGAGVSLANGALNAASPAEAYLGAAFGPLVYARGPATNLESFGDAAAGGLSFAQNYAQFWDQGIQLLRPQPSSFPAPAAVYPPLPYVGDSTAVGFLAAMGPATLGTITGSPAWPLTGSTGQPGSTRYTSPTASTDAMTQFMLSLNQLAASLNQNAQNSTRYPASSPTLATMSLAGLTGPALQGTNTASSVTTTSNAGQASSNVAACIAAYYKTIMAGYNAGDVWTVYPGAAATLKNCANPPQPSQAPAKSVAQTAPGGATSATSSPSAPQSKQSAPKSSSQSPVNSARPSSGIAAQSKSGSMSQAAPTAMLKASGQKLDQPGNDQVRNAAPKGIGAQPAPQSLQVRTTLIVSPSTIPSNATPRGSSNTNPANNPLPVHPPPVASTARAAQAPTFNPTTPAVNVYMPQRVNFPPPMIPPVELPQVHLPSPVYFPQPALPIERLQVDVHPAVFVPIEVVKSPAPGPTSSAPGHSGPVFPVQGVLPTRTAPTHPTPPPVHHK
jgi:hypothetical protein